MAVVKIYIRRTRDGSIVFTNLFVSGTKEYIGIVWGSTIGLALGTFIEDYFVNQERSLKELATDAGKAAAIGIVASIPGSYIKYAINEAKFANSAARQLSTYDEKFGEALEIFFTQIVNGLASSL